MKIVNFSVDDLDELMLFLDKNLTENYDKDVFPKIHKKWPEGFLLVKEKEKIVGVGTGAILPNEKLRILIIAVNKEHQGKGIGKDLIHRMIESSKLFKIKKITLEVRVDSDAVKFYQKLGFSKVDLLPCYYQDGCDGIVMEKLINNNPKNRQIFL